MAYDLIVKTDTRRLPPGQGQCDFCSSKKPIYWFPCQNFTHTVQPVNGTLVTGIMTEEWAACVDCTQLILDGSRVALAERCLYDNPTYSFFALREPHTAMTRRAELIRAILGLHRAFQKSRLYGPPCPVELVKVRG